MASLRDIKKNISSVKSIKQITYAMKMVAAARISARRYADSRPSRSDGPPDRDLYNDPAEDLSGTGVSELRSAIGDTLMLLLVTADKGLSACLPGHRHRLAKENHGGRSAVA